MPWPIPRCSTISYKEGDVPEAEMQADHDASMKKVEGLEF
jgi:hypothetical protein